MKTQQEIETEIEKLQKQLYKQNLKTIRFINN